MDEALKKINLRQSNDKPLTLDPSTIPNLVPEKLLKEWIEGDNDPYYKIQKIDYPLVANRYNYTESFFESFIGKLNARPIPGSKDGHETSWGKRGGTDILLVGAKMEKAGDGTGSVFFKNYFPPEGNETLIKEAKSDMIEFSLVSYTKDIREELPDGSVTYNVVESMYGERNDVVGYGEGAMEQKTNNKENKEGDGMGKKDEALLTLKNLKANAEITLLEIAKEIGLEGQVITDGQKQNLAKHESVKALCGDMDPVDFITALLDEKKENIASIREAKLTELFGAKEIDGKENMVRTQAETLIGDKEITDEVVEGVKENSIFKTLASEQADVDSDFNKVGISEGKKVNTSDEPGVVEV